MGRNKISEFKKKKNYTFCLDYEQHLKIVGMAKNGSRTKGLENLMAILEAAYNQGKINADWIQEVLEGEE